MSLRIFLLILFFSCSAYSYGEIQYLKNDIDKLYSEGRCESCNLGQARLSCKPNYILDGSNLVNARFGYDGSCNGGSFRNSIGTQLSFRTSCASCDFSSSILIKSNFEDANMPHANFSNANLSGAAFNAADVSGANFSGANLASVDFRRADLTNAVISEEQLKKTMHCGAILPNGTIGEC